MEELENMTLEEAVMSHRILWRGIADYCKMLRLQKSGKIFPPALIKREVFCHIFYQRITNNCFLCAYSMQLGKDGGCDHCPLCTVEQVKTNGCLNGLYRQWHGCVSKGYFEQAKILALQIAELPIVNRKGEERCINNTL